MVTFPIRVLYLHPIKAFVLYCMAFSDSLCRASQGWVQMFMVFGIANLKDDQDDCNLAF